MIGRLLTGSVCCSAYNNGVNEYISSVCVQTHVGMLDDTVGDSKNVPYFGRGHFGRVVLGNGWELELTFMLVRRAMKQAFIIISYSLGSSKFLNYCNLKTKKLTIFHPDCETNTRVPQSNEGEIGKCDTSKL